MFAADSYQLPARNNQTLRGDESSKENRIPPNAKETKITSVVKQNLSSPLTEASHFPVFSRNSVSGMSYASPVTSKEAKISYAIPATSFKTPLSQEGEKEIDLKPKSSEIQGKKTSDSLNMTPDDYLQKKIKEKTVEVLKIEGLYTSGSRLMLNVPGTDQFYVENPQTLIGTGAQKVVNDASLVDLRTGLVIPGQVVGRPKEDHVEESLQEFAHEKKIAKYLRSKIPGEVLENAILVPRVTKTKGRFGANAGQRVGNNLDHYVSRLSLKDKLGLSSRLIRDVLAPLHKANVTHRDVKPDNILILLDEKGEPLRDERGYLKFVLSDLGTCYLRETKAGSHVNLFKLNYTDPAHHQEAEYAQIIEDNFPCHLDLYMLGLTLVNLFNSETKDEFIDRQFFEAGISSSHDEAFHEKLYQWKHNFEKWPLWKDLAEELEDEGLSEENAAQVIQILKGLVNPDSSKRPFLKAAETFDHLFNRINL